MHSGESMVEWRRLKVEGEKMLNMVHIYEWPCMCAQYIVLLWWSSSTNKFGAWHTSAFPELVNKEVAV